MIQVEVWLYGPLSRYGGSESQGSHARLLLEMREGSTMADLLGRLGVPAEEKSITFVNGQLTDMPGLGADLDWELRQGDRVALFHRLSMWPFQYRHGATLSPKLRQSMERREGGALCHSPVQVEAGSLEREGGDRSSP